MTGDPLQILCATRVTDDLTHLLEIDSTYCRLTEKSKELVAKINSSKKIKKKFERWYEAEAECTAYVCEKAYRLGMYDGAFLCTNLKNM